MTTAIKVENLSKVYKLYDTPIDRMKEALHWRCKKYHKDFYALDVVSFEIKKGETVGIVGKNGSGKSTLLKIITGVLTPTSGSVMVNGRVAALLELGAGFNPEYTGIENIYFQGNLMGYSKEDMDSKIQDILSFADIGDFIHQKVKMYSSGMFARLAFAVAINVEPDVLIVDEALSVGDMAFQAKCFSKFKEFREKGVTILFVTHSVDTVIKYCESAILLNDGKKIEYGDSKTVVELFRKIMISQTRINGAGDNEEGFNDNHHLLNRQYNLKKQLPVNSKANVYGSLDAEIIDFAVINQERDITTQLYHNEEYTIEMSVRFNCDITDPIFAFTIRGIDSLELTGTNSLNLNENFGLIKAGEVVTVKFRQIMILNSGHYFLALGCTKFNNDNLTVFHRMYDILPIEVMSTVVATGVAFSVSEIGVIRN